MKLCINWQCVKYVPLIVVQQEVHQLEDEVEARYFDKFYHSHHNRQWWIHDIIFLAVEHSLLLLFDGWSASSHSSFLTIFVMHYRRSLTSTQVTNIDVTNRWDSKQREQVKRKLINDIAGTVRIELNHFVVMILAQ